MNKVAIAYSTKDRTDLTKQTLEPLREGPFDLYWFDGSVTKEGVKFFRACEEVKNRETLAGGSCRYIVYALTTLLAKGYDYIGLVENDCLLDADWFEPTMDLFVRGGAEGLDVGAVSARCYDDRILIQRDGYAVMHNLGAGQIILKREAAELILRQYRTGMTSENRKIFALLSGIDIASYWAFRGSDHMLVADWSYDRMLAERGMCSLALTPAKATQLEDIAAMGLTMAEGEVTARRDDKAFHRYILNLGRIRTGSGQMPIQPYGLLAHNGAHVFFAHQLPVLGGVYVGDWRFKWSLGYGSFGWKAGAGLQDDSCGTQGLGDRPTLTVPVFGPCELVVSGGADGGTIHVKDESGFEATPELYPEGEQGQVLRMAIPGTVNYRLLTVTAISPGVTIYGIITREAQPVYLGVNFDFNYLPPL